MSNYTIINPNNIDWTLYNVYNPFGIVSLTTYGVNTLIAYSFFLFFFCWCVFLFWPKNYRIWTLFIAVITFLAFLKKFLLLQKVISLYNYFILVYIFKFLNYNYVLQFDSLSLSFIVLSLLLFVICLLVIWRLKYKSKELVILLFVVNFLLINVFAVVELFLFYVFFEAILLPMFLLIGIWGSRERKIYAAYQFFLYTLLGSIFLLFVIIWLYSHYGTTDIRYLNYSTFALSSQLIMWLPFFVSIAVKVPMMPIHLWLPEAHVEAPTVGSVLLAGVLLKLGTYALIRFLFPLFCEASVYFAPFVLTLAVFSVVYASFTTLIQLDMKKLVAYSSVAHMNFVVLGLFVFNSQGFLGAIILMLSHGLVSSALFICVGFLYERYKTRSLLYISGLGRLLPLLSFSCFVFTLGNMGFPGTFSFIGEFLILLGVFLKNSVVGFLAGLSVIFSAGYSLILYSYTFHGSIRLNLVKYFADLSHREAMVLLLLVFWVVILGVFPQALLNFYEILFPKAIDLSFYF